MIGKEGKDGDLGIALNGMDLTSASSCNTIEEDLASVLGDFEKGNVIIFDGLKRDFELDFFIDFDLVLEDKGSICNEGIVSASVLDIAGCLLWAGGVDTKCVVSMGLGAVAGTGKNMAATRSRSEFQ
jgi:hypothetical protein